MPAGYQRKDCERRRGQRPEREGEAVALGERRDPERQERALRGKSAPTTRTSPLPPPSAA